MMEEIQESAGHKSSKIYPFFFSRRFFLSPVDQRPERERHRAFTLETFTRIKRLQRCIWKKVQKLAGLLASGEKQHMKKKRLALLDLVSIETAVSGGRPKHTYTYSGVPYTVYRVSIGQVYA